MSEGAFQVGQHVVAMGFIHGRVTQVSDKLVWIEPADVTRRGYSSKYWHHEAKPVESA